MENNDLYEYYVMVNGKELENSRTTSEFDVFWKGANIIGNSEGKGIYVVMIENYTKNPIRVFDAWEIKIFWCR